MRDQESPTVPEEREDVVANRARVRVVGEPRRGEIDELLLLADADGVVARASGEALTRLDFDEDEHPSAADDQIDLAASGAHVPRHDRVAAQAVEPRRAALARGAELPRRNQTLPEHDRRGYLGDGAIYRLWKCFSMS